MGSTTNELHLTPDAQADLQEIKRYISRDLENPVAALATVKRIVQNVRLLRGQARIGTPLSAVTELRDGADYRYLTSGSYMIFCRAVGTDVYIDRVLYGLDNAKVAYIISDRPQEIIRSISTELDRGVTILRGAGAWSGEAKDVLMCAFKQKQIVALKRAVKETDPSAFLIVCDAHEVLGQGFHSYHQHDL